MVARRLLLLAAVLLLLAALAAGARPARRRRHRAAAPASLARGRDGRRARSRPREGAGQRAIPVKRGDLLELEVAGDLIDTVLIERLDRIDAIEPTTPARFDLLIDAPAGVYPIRLVDADRRIGTIEITD